jgi:putative transcriptional regulator
MRIKLQRIREQCGFTQQQFADALGISRSHYSQIETGDKSPSLEVAIKIKKALRYDGDDIFEVKRPFGSGSPTTGRKKT